MAAAGKAYLDLFSLQKFSIHHKFSAYKMYIKTLELIGKKNLMANYMYTASSVKTAQVQSLFRHFLQTDWLADSLHTFASQGKHDGWCHAKYYTVQAVQTFPVSWDDQHKHTDTKSILTNHYRTFILFTLRDVNVQNILFLRINKPSVLFPSLWMLSKLTIMVGELSNLFTSLSWQIVISLSLIFCPSCI